MRNNTIRTVVCGLWFVAAAHAQKRPVTVDALSEAPRRAAQTRGDPLAWSPDGRSFLYREGARLMVYDLPLGTSRELAGTEAITAAAVKPAASSSGEPSSGQPFDWENRGVTEATAAWGAGDQILYESGEDLFMIHPGTGRWDQLTRTPLAERDPKLSPDGKRVAFRRGWDLYTLDVATRRETRLTSGGSDVVRNGAVDWVYPEELNLGTAYWWSPDSKAILYLQFDVSHEPLYPHEDLRGIKAIFEPQRYPQAGDNNADVRMGVVAATGGPTHWVDAGDTRQSFVIARAGWMPDSTHVYAVRLNRVQNHLELLSYGVSSRGGGSSGGPVKILEESDPYWINFRQRPQFIGANRFLWMSERDGFNHLYVYSLDEKMSGKVATQLTKGSWEVRSAMLDEADGRVLYTSDETSPLEVQLYSIRLDGSDQHRLSQGAGTHTVSLAQRITGAAARVGAYYLDTYSNVSSPPVTTIHSGDGKQVGVWREADLSRQQEFDILPVELSDFRLAGGTQLYARMIKPAGFEAGKKYPAIVRVYGGPGAQSVRNAWSGLSMDQVLAHAGFVVWEVDNRGSAGRGHAFETPVYHKLGSVELADQVAGVEHLISLGFVDPKRVGITGASYGGFMTLKAMLNAPDVFHAGIADAPVTGWRNYDTIYTERYMGLPAGPSADANPDGYKNTALPQFAKNLKGPLMIVHNLEDDNVLFQNTLQMVDALERADKPFQFMLYPQKTHGVRGAVTHQMNSSVLEFFERALK
jgi:dipeptidyl-peptidase-4